jgi:hypothetical protein
MLNPTFLFFYNITKKQNRCKRKHPACSRPDQLMRRINRPIYGLDNAIHAQGCHRKNYKAVSVKELTGYGIEHRLNLPIVSNGRFGKGLKHPLSCIISIRKESWAYG